MAPFGFFGVDRGKVVWYSNFEVIRMPRQARKKSESGIYHVMLRGINRQQIFQDEEDNRKFLDVLRQYKTVSGYELYAYCLMGNHVHLLIKEGKEELSQIFKRIAGRYVYWYNCKYQRVGHLFQDRFKSEPVEDDRYFLTVLRYIHLNPVKANLAVRPEAWRFSSYEEYLERADLIDTERVLEMMDVRSLAAFHREENDDSCLDVPKEQVRVTDEEAQRIVRRGSGVDSLEAFKALPQERKHELLNQWKERGLSVRQITLLTGASKKMISRTSQEPVVERRMENRPPSSVENRPPSSGKVDITIL